SAVRSPRPTRPSRRPTRSRCGSPRSRRRIPYRSGSWTPRASSWTRRMRARTRRMAGSSASRPARRWYQGATRSPGAASEATAIRCAETSGSRWRLPGDRDIDAGGWAFGAFDALTGWLLFAAIIFGTGPLAVRWLVLPRARAHGVVLDGRALRRLLARAGFRVTLLLPPAMLLVFVRQLVEFRDPFVPWSEDARLLLGGTAWGRTYLIGLAVAAIVPASYALARLRPVGWAVATAATLSMGTFPALTGHAS